MSSSSRCNTLLDARRRPGYGGTPLDQAERQRHGLGHGPRGAGHGAPESCLAVIQRSCAPSQALAVAHPTARLPNVLSIEHTNGSGALTMLVEVRDFAILSRFLLESPGSIPGVDNASGHAVAKVVAIGDHWQLNDFDSAWYAAIGGSPYRRADTITSDGGEVLRPYDSVDR
ncbi:Lrp/AsnC ligand binding domain-containing protein [Streptomyces sp. NPDC047917]|uniref:Lrp/AsnC ligand binding domain-containing protein n=1 Tax=Streptomyces sp. NPDC047917 TaxID=3365491 RepID=UPI00371A88D8